MSAHYGINLEDCVALELLTRRFKLTPHGFNFLPEGAAINVIVHQTHRLHEGISCGWAKKFPPAILQIFT
jgi:hypothetical protein